MQAIQSGSFVNPSAATPPPVAPAPASTPAPVVPPAAAPVKS